MKAYKYLDTTADTRSTVLLSEKDNNVHVDTNIMREIEVDEVSDGYHTFGELYHCRHILFATVCMSHADKAWKSKLHDDGTMFDNFFIAGIDTPNGNYTFHIEEEYWDMFDIKEINKAPEFDGHTLKDIEDRLISLVKHTVTIPKKFKSNLF